MIYFQKCEKSERQLEILKTTESTCPGGGAEVAVQSSWTRTASFLKQGLMGWLVPRPQAAVLDLLVLCSGSQPELSLLVTLQSQPVWNSSKASRIQEL